MTTVVLMRLGKTINIFTALFLATSGFDQAKSDRYGRRRIQAIQGTLSG